jgi:outer membrane lipoprotein SlyB
MTDDRTFDRDIVTADGSHRDETIETDDPAGAHQTTERVHLSNDPGTDDEQVKGFVAGGVGGAVVGAIVAGPVGAVVGGAIGATSGAAVGVGAEAVDEKSKHDEVVAEHEARRP